ncbi:Conserved_hypothetical protein [Hexamita inflata]|uniref:Uncharacterized protein n=1 Tax=Hexamita inflata TaxID=28002 RepID=A0AA86UQB5_9EUKA|nr:Conserved hypothetical protein [Hexamita inflata]
MIIIVQTLNIVMTDCYSTKSYLRGNPATLQLVLHLLPFESIVLVTDGNMCQSYLPGKNVNVKLHYEDISFPSSGVPITFKYAYNVEQTVVFQLSQADYDHILDFQDAMYELWFDTNFVNVNNSIDTISHTKQNGTGCFQSLYMEYTIYSDIVFNVVPNICQVVFDGSLVVSLEYALNGALMEIVIEPCQSGCEPTEFQTASSDFSLIRKYKLKVTPGTEAVMQIFYEQYVQNRLIDMHLKLVYNDNGIDSVIYKQIEDKRAVDTWGCRANDYYFFQRATLNPSNLFVQFRLNQMNKMLCSTQAATSVLVDIYLISQNEVRLQQNISLSVFNAQIGVEFSLTEQLKQIRFNSSAMSLLVFSFVNGDQILYEISVYKSIKFGCVRSALLQIYTNKICLRILYEQSEMCKSKTLSKTESNLLSVNIQNEESLGLYNFQHEIKYSDVYSLHCFECAEYINSSVSRIPYKGQTCAENQQIMRQMAAKGKITYGIFTLLESTMQNSTSIENITQKAIEPLFITSTLLLTGAIVVLVIFFCKQRQEQ